MVTPVAPQSLVASGIEIRLSPVSAFFHFLGGIPGVGHSSAWVFPRASRVSARRAAISTTEVGSGLSAIRPILRRYGAAIHSADGYVDTLQKSCILRPCRN